MKRATLATSLLAASLTLAMTGVAAPPKAGPSSADAPRVPTVSSLMEKEIHWGLTHEELTDLYNLAGGLFDREYAQQLAHLSPGVAQQQMESDRDSRKANFERSYTRFTDTPTGYDVTPLHVEYTYKNDEAVQRLLKDGKTRYFFYIKDHLWKVYDEIPLKADGPLGATFQDAVAKLNTRFGVPARVRPANAAGGVERTTADWQDQTTHLRAIDRSGEHVVALVFEDKSTLNGLAMLRANKPADPFAIDPAIAAVTKHGIIDPNAAKGVDGGPGSGKKKGP
ncbi:MAG: hypothetical protein M3O50_03840 [Myxococcota bacterium]|nr:hypothetical protein [Myxococcota bacterium]